MKHIPENEQECKINRIGTQQRPMAIGRYRKFGPFVSLLLFLYISCVRVAILSVAKTGKNMQ
jgi:hypothetical protein